MVIGFGTLPEHVQAKIARKLDIWDFKQFDASSKQAKYICHLLKDRLILLDASLNLERGFDFMIERPERPPKRWTMNVFTWPENVRFCLNAIRIYNKDGILSALHFAEIGNILCRNVSLTWFVDDAIPLSLFEKMLEIFNISHLSYDVKTIDEQFFSLPRLLELQSIAFFMVVIPDESFLQFKAHTLDICALTSHPHFGPTMNSFFKQWYAGNREIRKLIMNKDGPSNTLGPETLFEGIPHSVLWRKEKPHTIFPHLRLTEVFLRIEAVYLLQKEEKKLLVIDKHLQIVTLEPEGDAEDYAAKLLTGRLQFPLYPQ